MKPSSVAKWVRALRLVDRQVALAYRFHEAFRDEILFAFVPPDRRTAVTATAYGQIAKMYLPGGRSFECGLLDWERASPSLMNVRRGSRVLVGGIGGGRELGDLVELGCRIVGFDPSLPLVESAQRVARALCDIEIHQASYEDFVQAEANHDDRLAPLLGPHDAVVLGRGSFGHLTDEAQQLALLRALRRSSPNAPVLLSFAMRRSSGDDGTSVGVRRALRTAFGHVGGHSVPPGLRYDSGRGFVYHFIEPEIRDLAARSGYRVATFEKSTYGLPGGRPPAHAVFVPDK